MQTSQHPCYQQIWSQGPFPVGNEGGERDQERIAKLGCIFTCTGGPSRNKGLPLTSYFHPTKVPAHFGPAVPKLLASTVLSCRDITDLSLGILGHECPRQADLYLLGPSPPPLSFPRRTEQQGCCSWPGSTAETMPLLLPHHTRQEQKQQQGAHVAEAGSTLTMTMAAGATSAPETSSRTRPVTWSCSSAMLTPRPQQSCKEQPPYWHYAPVTPPFASSLWPEGAQIPAPRPTPAACCRRAEPDSPEQSKPFPERAGLPCL